MALTPAPPPGGPEPAAPGRPRDDTRERAILDAALALVAEVGFERMTMDAIASRARASKATIYRRWASKQELVIDAMHCYVGEALVEPEDTGSLRGDLAWLVHHAAEGIRGFDGHLIMGLAQAALSDPGLCAAMEERLHAEKQHAPRVIVGRAVARGELTPGTDPGLFNEIVPPVVIMRLVNGQPLDDAFLDHLVDDIVLPALRHASPVLPHPTPPTPARRTHP